MPVNTPFHLAEKVVRDRRLIGKTGLDPKQRKSALVFPVRQSDFTRTNPLMERRMWSPAAFPKVACPRRRRYDLQGKSQKTPTAPHSQQTLTALAIDFYLCESLPRK